MTGPLRFGALLLLVLTLVACATYWTRGGGDQIRFSHGVHEKAQVGCPTCHESIYDAKDLVQTGALPKEKVCLACHEEMKTKNVCGFCHTDPARPGTYPQREVFLRMNHAQHIERTKEECSTCHLRLPEPGQTPTVAFSPASTYSPTMEGCLSCHPHRQEYDTGRCQACHLDLGHYPIKPVASFSHQSNFVREHPRAARAAQAACATCHEQTFCADCHAKTVNTRVELKFPDRSDRDFIHRNDFLGRHSLESKADPPSCLRCHGVSFCERCHAQQNLTQRGQNPRDPHPPGWAVAGSPAFHGTAARRDITSCASCHDQGPRSNCIDCHKVGGSGGNPHPLGWLQHHDRAEVQRNGMCLYCHL